MSGARYWVWVVVGVVLAGCSSRARPNVAELDCRGWVNTFHVSLGGSCTTNQDCFDGQRCANDRCVVVCEDTAACRSMTASACPSCDWQAGADGESYPRCPPGSTTRDAGPFVRDTGASNADAGSAVRETINGALEVGDTMVGTSYADFHLVSLPGGVPVTITLRARPAFDPQLFVFDTASPPNELAFNDDSIGLDSQVVFVPPSSGSYSLGVTSYGAGETGPYTITIAY